MRKGLILVALPLALLISPFATSATKNNLKARALRVLLESTDLPRHARIIDSTSRVFVGGNGNGCDYQAILLVSYYGSISDLKQPFRSTLETFVVRPSDAEIIEVDREGSAVWTLKIMYQSTELSITPNADRAGLYMIHLTNWPRAESLDLRCM